MLRVNGTLEYRETNGKEWKTAKIGQSLCNGFQIRTLTGNKAIIVFSSGMRVLINENTKLEITAHTPAKFQKLTTKLTRFLAGEVYSKTKPMKDGQHNTKSEYSSSVASILG